MLGKPFPFGKPASDEQLQCELRVVIGVLLEWLAHGERVARHEIAISRDRQGLEQSVDDLCPVDRVREGLAHLHIVERGLSALEEDIVNPEVLRVDLNGQRRDARRLLDDLELSWAERLPRPVDLPGLEQRQLVGAVVNLEDSGTGSGA